MSDDRQYKVTTRRRGSGGGWMYQLFIVGGDPLAFDSDNKSYTTQQEAERAGYEAVAAKQRLR